MPTNRQKVAIVTGGTRGIGREITAALRDDGYAVAAFYHHNDEAARECESATGARAFKVEVTDFVACQAACERVAAEMGWVSVLVNNAGITRDGMLHKMELDDWNLVLQTNLTAAFHMCRAVIGGMRANNFGRVINIGSINGQKGQLGQTAYSAAKAGLIGLTKALALESASKNVTVNAICPGYIETDMTAAMKPEILQAIVQQIPLGRLGQAHEIAAMVAFLVSDKAAFITGATLAANGGQHMG